MADFQRQLDILPPSALIYPINIIGLGGIGSRVAYDARKMGFTHFNLWDSDIVEEHNLPSQHFDNFDTGQPKVIAMANQMKISLDTKCEITIHKGRFTKKEKLEGVVVSGVDNMDTRNQIWESIKTSPAFTPLLIDGRIGIQWDEELGMVTGEFIEVLTIVPSNLADRELYESQLFSDEEAAPLRCTAQAVVYVGSIIAGFMNANLKKWIMNEQYHRHILYDCLTNQILIARL